MAFIPKKYDGSDVKQSLITNSQAITIGEVLIPATSGEVSSVSSGGGTTSYLLGVTLGFRDNNGASLEFNTITAASNNLTVAQIYAVYLPFHMNDTEYKVELSAAAGTTPGSSAFGNFVVDSTGLLVSESSYAAFGTRTGLQLFSYGLTGNPDKAKEVTCVFFATVVGGLS